MTADVETGRRARVVIARELACPLGRLTDGAEFRRDLGADSLDLVNVPRALEDEFGIALTDGEVEFCQTVGTAIDLIRSKLENGGSLDRRSTHANRSAGPTGPRTLSSARPSSPTGPHTLSSARPSSPTRPRGARIYPFRSGGSRR